MGTRIHTDRVPLRPSDARFEAAGPQVRQALAMSAFRPTKG